LKKIQLNIKDIFNLPSAVIYNPDDLKSVSDVVIDSRKVKKGSLFIAIKGKKLDGHNFVQSAVKNGAGAVIIDRRRYNQFDNIDVPIITVENSVKALGSIANTWRKKINAKVIGITGSSGKTSTKEILAVLLSEKFKVNKTENNNNNHIGVPLTVLSTNLQHEVLVAEVGTNHFGEIEYSAKILEPDYAVITNIGTSHIEFLKNKKGVLKEKSALLMETMKRNGKIFLNYDDPLLKDCFSNYKNRFTFGFDTRADISGKVLEYQNDGKPLVEVNYGQKKISKALPVYGEISARNYLAASAISLKLGLNISQLINGTDKLKSFPGRLNVFHYRNFVLIDDTYNANPDSTMAAIELMDKIRTYSKKIIILGDMFELGKDEIKIHQNLKSVIHHSGIDEVYTIGTSMKYLNESLSLKRFVKKHFRTRNQLKDFLNKMDFDNSVILVKGSRGMQMEEFVEIIKVKPADNALLFI
jgi:UDP-N-acetylmuramoyl-tripeptide--D-alanyl-D-alanine ligase